MKLASHLLLFQLGWFSCVLGASWGHPLAGPLVVAVIAVVHRWLFPVRGESRLLAASAVAGAAVDSLLAGAGLVRYSGNVGPEWLAPPWIVAMWVNFALTLPRSLRWLQTRPVPAAILGAIFGPLAYVAGERLEAVELSSRFAAPALAVLWAGSVTLLAGLARPSAGGGR